MTNDDRGDSMPSADRRAQPPVSLDVIAYQVGALQTSVDRGLGQLERTIERGLSDLRVEVHGLSNRVGEVEKSLARMDTRVSALEQFKSEQEVLEREVAALQRQETRSAMDDSFEAKLYRKLAFLLVSSLAAIGTVITILAALGVFK